MAKHPVGWRIWIQRQLWNSCPYKRVQERSALKKGSALLNQL